MKWTDEKVLKLISLFKENPNSYDIIKGSLYYKPVKKPVKKRLAVKTIA